MSRKTGTTPDHSLTTHTQDVEGQGDMFTVVEKADITAEQLRETKINKVMRKIVGLDKIPLDETYHFRERAEALLHKWHSIEQSKNGADGSAESPAKKEEGASSTAPVTSEAAAAPTNGESAGANGSAANGGAGATEEGSSKAEMTESSAPAATTTTAADETVGDLTEVQDEKPSNGDL